MTRHKEIVERRHGEPIKFLFLPKIGLLGSQAGNEKKMLVVNYQQLWEVFLEGLKIGFFRASCFGFIVKG